MGTIPPIVSVDDHVVEPPDLWSSRLPARYRDIGPHVELHPMGTPRLDGGNYIEAPGTEGKPIAWWCYEDHRFDEMRPGCWQPKERLLDMDSNHVEASLCFPNYPRFCGQLFMRGKDRELAKLCVEAYNDWMVEEWCGDSGGRLIPLCLVPLWDAELAAAEVRRNATRGVNAVAFSECPAWLDLPSIHSAYWDPFLRACDETGTVLCMHIGSGTKTFQTSVDAPAAVSATGMFTNTAMSMIDWLYSGRLLQFPGVKILYAECQIGWIPYVLERVDDVWNTHHWSRDEKVIPQPPSSLYYSNMFTCFFKDHVGIQLLDKVGEDNICFEVDYPHQDSTWPDTESVAQDIFGHLAQTQIDKIARGNAERLFGTVAQRLA